jgi:hypothetical protein
MSWDSLVVKVTTCGIDDRGSIPGRKRNFPVRHQCNQTGSGERSASYPMCAVGNTAGT